MVVRRLALLAVVVVCLALSSPVWAGTVTFGGTAPSGQGMLNFTPGLGHTLSIGAGSGGLGALVSDMFISTYVCGGECAVTNGYLTLTTGAETSGFTGGGTFAYAFAKGGTLSIIGGMPFLGIANGTTLLSFSFLPGASFTGSITTGIFAGSADLTTLLLNAQLASNLGKITYTGGSNDEITISLNNVCQSGGKCTGPILSDSTGLEFIPEPATLSVMGVGLFAFGAGLRRKMANTANTMGA